jgi:uncharacterized protein (TIGR01777 family)
MRILLTGGTGFIGSELAPSLTRRGDEVVLVSRSGRGGVGWDAVDAEVARADAVVHLAGESIAGARFTASHLGRVRSSRVETTSRLATAMEASARKPRVFVSASAVGIYGMRRDDDVEDESAAPGNDAVAEICVAWERCADPARVAGVRVVHPRFGTVLARGGGALAKLEVPFRFFVGGPLGDGKQWVSWVHRRDAVRAILFLLDEPSCAGPFIVVAPEAARMDDLARELGAAMHRPALLRAPAVALRVALGQGLAQLLLTGQRAAPRRLEQAGFRFEYPRLAPALAALYERSRS